MLTSIVLVPRGRRKLDELTRVARAVDLQVRRDVGPVWNVYANIFAAPWDAVLPASTWRVFVDDEPDLAGTYGHHETSAGARVPVGHVFTEPPERAGVPWSVVASHEVLEMLVDPWINLSVARRFMDGHTELWPREVCDAVEGASYRVEGVAGVDVADFVYPAYFCDGAPGPYDHLERVAAPFGLLPTGYSSVTRITADGKVTVTDEYAVHFPAWRRAPSPATRQRARRCDACCF